MSNHRQIVPRAAVVGQVSLFMLLICVADLYALFCQLQCSWGRETRNTTLGMAFPDLESRRKYGLQFVQAEASRFRPQQGADGISRDVMQDSKL